MTGIQRCIVALAVLILAGCGPKDEQLVDVKAAAARQARGELLLDIREAEDYKEFHIPNTMNIPYGRLALRMEELESYKGKPVMVIDHSGLRAPRAMEQLQKAGFTQVQIVQGGWPNGEQPVFRSKIKGAASHQFSIHRPPGRCSFPEVLNDIEAQEHLAQLEQRQRQRVGLAGVAPIG